MLTGHPNGISSFGIPIAPGIGNMFGNVWFVDGNAGLDGNDGKSTSRPVATVGKAISLASKQDTIYINGLGPVVTDMTDPNAYSEQLTIPVGKYGMKLVGAGANRHNPFYTQIKGSAAGRIIEIKAPGTVIENLDFNKGSATTGMIYFNGDNGTTAMAWGCVIANCHIRNANSEGNAGIKFFAGSYNTIVDCIFEACATGIYVASGGTFPVRSPRIERCSFLGANQAAVTGPNIGSTGVIYELLVKDCTFERKPTGKYIVFSESTMYGEITNCWFGHGSSITPSDGGSEIDVHAQVKVDGCMDDSGAFNST